MCGRYAVSANALACAAQLAGQHKESIPPYIQPCFNFGPGMKSVIIAAGKSAGQRILIPAVWGLITFSDIGSNDEVKVNVNHPKSKYNHFAMFNARAETVLEKPSFKVLAKTSGRCVVVADGFYEWKNLNQSTKQPYFVEIKGRLSFLAALYKTIQTLDGTLTTYTILTTESCDAFKTVHDRQPLFLSTDQVSSWLHPDLEISSDFLNDLQENQRHNGILQLHGHWHAVTPKMGNIAYQGADCCKAWQPLLSFAAVKPKARDTVADTAKASATESSTQQDRRDSAGVVAQRLEMAKRPDNPISSPWSPRGTSTFISGPASIATFFRKNEGSAVDAAVSSQQAPLEHQTKPEMAEIKAAGALAAVGSPPHKSSPAATKQVLAKNNIASFFSKVSPSKPETLALEDDPINESARSADVVNADSRHSGPALSGAKHKRDGDEIKAAKKSRRIEGSTSTLSRKTAEVIDLT